MRSSSLPRAHTVGVLRAVCIAAATSAPADAQWTYGPAVPSGGAARSHCALLHDGVGTYLVGGLPVTSGGDAPAHQWTNGAWIPVAPIEGLFLDGGFAVDELGRVLVIAGADSGGDPGDHYVWNPVDGGAGGIGERAGDSPSTGFAVAHDDLGRVVCLGGAAAPSAPAAAAPGVVDRYDAGTDEWTRLAPLPTPVNDAAACNDGHGHLLVFGGYDAGGARSANVARYDLSTGAWSDTAIPDMPVALAGAAAVRGNDGLVYVIGGADATGPSAAVHVLDPVSGMWAAGPPMNEAREHFGCRVDAAGFIWAAGGTTTNTVESMFTSTCPTVVGVHAPTAYVGTVASLGVALGGSPPFTHTWRADGVPLFDGPTGFGSELSGTDGPDLVVRGVTAADGARTYDCVVSNACGTVTSDPVSLGLTVAPALPAAMDCTSLHPAGATSSSASSVDGGAVAGTTSYVHPQWNTLSRPALWTAPGSAPPLDLTPPNSVGGACSHMRDGVVVGWWWWPYTVPNVGTGYNQHAALWHLDGTHFEMQQSGWEFGSIAATDGTHHAGTARADESSTNSIGVRYTGTVRGGVGLTPQGAWGSSAAVVDGGVVFGSVHLGFGVVHPAMWSGNSSTFVDLAPPGSGRGYVYGADGGLQVGAVYSGNTPTACMWGGSAASFTELRVPGESVSVSTTRHGLMLGTRTVGGLGRAALFREGVGQWFDLSSSLPAGYSAAAARDLEYDAATGVLTVVGSARNDTLGRTEAMMWQSVPAGPTPATEGPGSRGTVGTIRRRP